MILFLLLILYTFTRLYHLTILPIFFDEANFIFWAKKIATTNAHWFISLSGQKNILLIWLMVPFLKILPGNLYLTAGRLPSVLTGAFTLIGTYSLGRELFGRRTGYLASLLYLLCPFALLYDRLALYDSLLAATMSWAIFFLVKTTRTQSLTDSLSWGTAMGLAFLSKATAVLFWILGPVGFLLLSWTQKMTGAGLKKIVILILAATILGQVLNHSIIISSGYSYYMRRALEYTPSLSQFIGRPLALLGPNLRLDFAWLSTYLTWPLFTALIPAHLFTLAKKPRAELLLLTLIVPSLLVFAFLARIYFPRYILFLTPYLLLPVAYLASRGIDFGGLGRIITGITLVLLLLAPLHTDLYLLTDPPRASLPAIDNWQYLTGFPSGYGLDRIFDFLNGQLKTGKHLTVFVQGSYSHYPNAFHLRYWDNPAVTIKERWPLTEIDQEMLTAQLSGPVYLVLRDNYLVEPKVNYEAALGVRILLTTTKPGGRDNVYLAVPDPVRLAGKQHNIIPPTQNQTPRLLDQ